MKVLILDKELEFNNDEQEIESIFEEIDQIILESNYVFSHLVIDGIEIYDNHYECILDKIEAIEEVKVITKTSNELAQDTLLSTVDYLTRALPAIERLSNEFYKNPKQESWTKLIDLFEGLKWIIDTFMVLDGNYKVNQIVKSYEGWNLYAQGIYSLKELLNEFESYLNDQDFISIADILSYEMAPLFKDMLDKLNAIISEEVTSHAIN